MRGLGEIVKITPLDCKKTSVLSITVHLTLDRIGYLLYDVINYQKSGGLEPQSPDSGVPAHCYMAIEIFLINGYITSKLD